MSETKTILCRYCSKPFEATAAYYTPQKGKVAGRKIAKWPIWCSVKCYRRHLKEISQ